MENRNQGKRDRNAGRHYFIIFNSFSKNKVLQCKNLENKNYKKENKIQI